MGMALMVFCVLPALSLTAVAQIDVALQQTGQQEPTAQKSRPKLKRTLSESMSDCELVLFAKRISSKPHATAEGYRTGSFEIVRVLKGGSLLATGERFEAVQQTSSMDKDLYCFIGNAVKPDRKSFDWWHRFGMSEDDGQYLVGLMDQVSGQEKSIEHNSSEPNSSKPNSQEQKLTGVDRLDFFMAALEHSNLAIADNAHLEFSLGSDDDLVGLKSRMDHDWLVRLVRSPSTLKRRSDLYYAMLSICDDRADLEWLESGLRNRAERHRHRAQEIACYLAIAGPEGLPLIRQFFFEDETMEFVDALAGIAAIRLISNPGWPEFSREELVSCFRIFLDRPGMADVVIPDLSRLEDWSSMERISELFFDDGQESQWTRVPAVLFMLRCPQPEALEYLAKFEVTNPDAVARAKFFSEPEDRATDTDQAEGDSQKIVVPQDRLERKSKFLRPFGRTQWRTGFRC